MSIETINHYPDNFRVECREVATQLKQGAIGLPEACRRIIGLDTKYQAKLNSWVALVNGDAHRGTPQATTKGISEAVAAAREELQRVARQVLPA